MIGFRETEESAREDDLTWLDEGIRNSDEGRRRRAKKEEEHNTPIHSRPRESIVTKKGKSIAQSSKSISPSSSSSSRSDDNDDDDNGGGDYGGNNEGSDGDGHCSLPPNMSWARGDDQYYAA